MSNKKKKPKEKSYKKKKYEKFLQGKDARIAEIQKIQEPERNSEIDKNNDEAIKQFYRRKR